jgi:hypothetical protein
MPPPKLDLRWYRKDANEVLIKDGAAFLKAFVDYAEPLPIRGLLRFHEYYEDIVKYYYLELKDGQGVSTGWPSLDKFYKVGVWVGVGVGGGGGGGVGGGIWGREVLCAVGRTGCGLGRLEVGQALLAA